MWGFIFYFHCFRGLKTVFGWGSSGSRSVFPSLGLCPCLSGEEFFVVSLLGEVCGGLVIESTSVLGAFGFSLFLIFFVVFFFFVSLCCNFDVCVFFCWWFIFGDCSYNSSYFLYQCLHFVYELGNYFRFCGCFRFAHMIIFFVGDRDILFCHFCVFCCFYHSSSFLICYFLVCFNLVISFFPYFTIFRPGTVVSLAVGTFVVSLAVFMYAIFPTSSAYWWSCTLVLMVSKPLTFVAS